MAETYRGWEIRESSDYYFDFQRFQATQVGYDASYEGPEDGWVGSGPVLNDSTVENLKKEIDCWIEENSDAE